MGIKDYFRRFADPRLNYDDLSRDAITSLFAGGAVTFSGLQLLQTAGIMGSNMSRAFLLVGLGALAWSGRSVDKALADLEPKAQL
jgi:hypothetical protein